MIRSFRHRPHVSWVPGSWPEASKPTFPLSEVAKHPFIMPLSDSENDIDAPFVEHGVAVDDRFAVHDGYTAWRMVEAGLGISVNNLLMSQLWEGNIAVHLLDPPASIELGIAVRSVAAASPAGRALVDRLRVLVARMRS